NVVRMTREVISVPGYLTDFRLGADLLGAEDMYILANRKPEPGHVSFQEGAWKDVVKFGFHSRDYLIDRKRAVAILNTLYSGDRADLPSSRGCWISKILAESRLRTSGSGGTEHPTPSTALPRECWKHRNRR